MALGDRDPLQLGDLGDDAGHGVADDLTLDLCDDVLHGRQLAPDPLLDQPG